MLIKKIDEDLQIVYGEIYVPDIPDADVEFMTKNEVRAMAYRFMAGNKGHSIDVNHENVLINAMVVESFIAREGDPDYIPFSWVGAVWIGDEGIWEDVKAGEINGFSIQAEIVPVERVIELEIPEYVKGLTDLVDGHTHKFTIGFNEDGTFSGGTTTVSEGHKHVIRRPAVTEDADGHNHRFSFLEELVNEQ